MKLSKTAWCAVTIIALFMFQMIGVPFNANAKWHSRADELPGLWKPSTTEVVLLVAASGVLIYGLWALSKSEKEKVKEEELEETEKESASSISNQSSCLNAPNTNLPKFENLEEQFSKIQNKVPLTVFCLQDNGAKNLGLGLAFKF